MPKAQNPALSSAAKTLGRSTQYSSTNPSPGRPKGTRDKISRQFIEALSADFEKHGVSAVEQVRTEKPADYLRIIASILPAEVEVTHTVDEMSDEELQVALEHVRTKLAVTAEHAGERVRKADFGKPH